MRTRFLVLVIALHPFAVAHAAALSEDEVDRTFLAAPINVRLQSTPPRPANNSLPTPLRQALPEYPIEMRKIGASGEVTFRVRVDSHGTVSFCDVTKATNRVFEAAVREAVMHWTYVSESRASATVIEQMSYTVSFQIDLDDKK